MNFLPKFTRANLVREIESGQHFKFLFFWGHQEHSTPSKASFSQWYPAQFSIDGNTYSTAEQWMMAEKARLFQDQEIYREILQTSNPGKAKDLGRKVKNFDQGVWEANRIQIVIKGNLAKFSQNKELKEFLANTGDRVLVEASPVDYIWGIGLSQDEEAAQDPRKWQGPNLLGFALMEVREQLKQNS
ncbi:NADAR family protein [bacterium]|nr:NADAR family protein [bacterium]